MAEMRVDPRLNSRVQSCVIEQAQAQPTSEFTDTIKLNAMTVGTLFMTLMHIDPAMSFAYEQEGEDSVTDEMIVSGVQTNWFEVERLWRQQSGLPPEGGTPPPSPEVTSVSPTTGARNGGVTLTITGVALTDTTKVSLNNIACTALSVVSDTSTAVATQSGQGLYPVVAPGWQRPHRPLPRCRMTTESLLPSSLNGRCTSR
jgi:hypothetical protein